LRCRYAARDLSTGNGWISFVADTRAVAEAGLSGMPRDLLDKLASVGWSSDPPEVMEIIHQYVRGDPGEGQGFLRMVHWHIDPSRYAEMEALAEPVRDKAEAEAGANGLRCRYIGYDPGSGKGLISTVWDTRAEAEAGVQVSDEHRQKMQAIRTPDEIVVMEVGTAYVKRGTKVHA
jgi:hypothetical protein